jgi:hypothetical protein
MCRLTGFAAISEAKAAAGAALCADRQKRVELRQSAAATLTSHPALAGDGRHQPAAGPGEQQAQKTQKKRKRKNPDRHQRQLNRLMRHASVPAEEVQQLQDAKEVQQLQDAELDAEYQ